MLEQINAAREVGIHLLELKEVTKHGDWLGMFASAKGKAQLAPVLTFEYTTGLRYMAISTKFPDAVTDLPDAVRSMKDLMVAGGELEAATREPQNRSSIGPFAKAESELGDFFAIISKEREKLPVEDWPEERRAQLKTKLRPAVELYETL